MVGREAKTGGKAEAGRKEPKPGAERAEARCGESRCQARREPKPGAEEAEAGREDPNWAEKRRHRRQGREVAGQRRRRESSTWGEGGSESRARQKERKPGASGGLGAGEPRQGPGNRGPERFEEGNRGWGGGSEDAWEELKPSGSSQWRVGGAETKWEELSGRKTLKLSRDPFSWEQGKGG